MSDDPKPTVSIGFFTIPMVTANFSTGDKGDNELVAKYIEFCGDVLTEGCKKLQAAAQQYFAQLGIVVNYMTHEEMANYLRQVQVNTDGETRVVAVVTPEGKVIEDEHAIEAIVSGRSINN